MGMGGGLRGGPAHSRVSGADFAAQRALNAQAPRIEHLLRRIAGLFDPYRGALALTVVLVLVSAGLSVVPPLLTQRLFDDALFPATGRVVLPLLLGLSGAMVGLFLLSSLLGVWQTYLTATVGNQVTGSLRLRLFEHLQAMELGFFTRTRTGVIQSRLQNDVGGVSSVLANTVSSVLGNVVQVVAALVAMVLLNGQLALVALVLMPLFVLVQRRVGQVRARIASRTQESLSEMTAITQEALSVSGILLGKSFNRQATEVARYAAENDRQVRLQVFLAMSGQWFMAMVQVFLAAIPVVVYLVAGWLLHDGATNISAGTIVAFTGVQARMLAPLVGVMRTALDLQTSGALFARIFEYLDLRPAIADAPDAVALPARPGEVGVEFEHVTFHYPDAKPGERPTLDDIAFRIAPGSFAAFVGPSGAGKTTVSYLIPRFYDAAAGTVRVAGQDVRTLTLDSLLAHIGVVSQETYLFHATIEDNLRYAKPDATRAELEEACRKADIDDTIAGFPDGYATVVGERGYRLSGGEKQRIAIARVLLKDPEILLLDEATSSLDSLSEQAVQRALDAATTGRTTIAIAHRLSTIVNADRIFVIDEGRLVEDGTHADLVARDGVYARLWRQQTHAGAEALAVSTAAS